MFQAPTQPPSLYLASVSQPDTALPPTVSLPVPAKLAPSLLKPPLLLSEPEAPSPPAHTRPLPAHGSTTSCKSTLHSCSPVSSPVCSSPRPRERPSRISPVNTIWSQLTFTLSKSPLARFHRKLPRLLRRRILFRNAFASVPHLP
jgi:hypothetical protein